MPSAEHLLRRMTMRQFLSWEAYFNQDVVGQRRRDYQNAYIVQTLLHVNKNWEKHPEPIPLEDCVLKFEAKGKRTWQEQKELMLDAFGVPPELRKKKGKK